MINEDRFWSRIAEDGDCWIWGGQIDKKGYGQLSANGTTLRAHRVAYEFVVGRIPAGLVLDHLCRNRACVNPAHLEPVTHQENVRRGERAQMTQCKYGHEFTPENTYIYQGIDGTRRRCRACTRERTRRWRERKTNPTSGGK